MGSTCGCSSPEPSMTPRPQGTGEYQIPTTRRSKPKFKDIIPIKHENIEETRHYLDVLNHDLSNYLHVFQHNNGDISKIITCNYSEHNCSKLKQFTNSFQFKEGLNKRHRESSENEQMYLPLTNDHINLELDLENQSKSSSLRSQQSNKEFDSCLLTQPSHILTNSLFTERKQAKRQFYQKYNKIGNTKMLEWNQYYRQSYKISLQQMSSLATSQQNCLLLVVLQAIRQYYNSHSVHLLSYSSNSAGLKVYINGQKRLFPFSETALQQPALSQLSEELISHISCCNVSEMIYNLTGWIPQTILLNDIKHFNGIFERLSNNIQEGNALVMFSRKTQNGEENMVLKCIDFQAGFLFLNTGGSKSTVPEMLFKTDAGEKNQIQIKIQDFVELFDTIYLNWNPIIYEETISRQGQISNSSRNKYVLVIPPSSQDIEIRLFLEQHHNYSNNQSEKIRVRLYEYENKNLEDDQPIIRQIQSESSLISDVFIFQSCKEKTQYLISIEAQSQMSTDLIFYTITLLSFVEMHFYELKEKPLLKQISLASHISSNNIGYGINSPYFGKNLQFQLETNIQQELTVYVEASSSLIYQICLIPDSEKKRHLTKIKLETIINNSLISSEKKGNGSFTIKTECKNYLLLLNVYSSIEQDIIIKLELRGTKINGQNLLNFKQLFTKNDIIYFQEIKWLPTHSGPRKRLKSNSINTFQPANNFIDFFKNPIIDKLLIKGRYQFFIRSETFRDYFDSVDHYEDKNQCQPPALAMAILQVQRDKREYRIVLDDALYIPFGIGFWSHQIEIQEGFYRFILPKMDKNFAKGTFGIIKC